MTVKSDSRFCLSLFIVFFGFSEDLFLFRASLIAYGAARFARGLAARLAFAASGRMGLFENFGGNSFDMFHK